VNGISGGNASTVSLGLVGRSGIGEQRVPASWSCMTPGPPLRLIGDGRASRAVDPRVPLGLRFDGHPVESALT